MPSMRKPHLMLLAGICCVALPCAQSDAQAPWQVPAAYWENNPYAPPANGYYPVRPLVPYAINYSPTVVYPSPNCVAPGNIAPDQNSKQNYSPEQKLAILKQHLLE